MKIADKGYVPCFFRLQTNYVGNSYECSEEIKKSLWCFLIVIVGNTFAGGNVDEQKINA